MSSKNQCLERISSDGQLRIRHRFIGSATRSLPLTLLQVFVEPCQSPGAFIALVFGLNEHVPFPRVYHQFGWDAERLQGVPEFKRLRRGAFGILLAHYDQRGGGYSLDEIDRRTLCVD